MESTDNDGTAPESELSPYEKASILGFEELIERMDLLVAASNLNNDNISEFRAELNYFREEIDSYHYKLARLLYDPNRLDRKTVNSRLTSIANILIFGFFVVPIVSGIIIGLSF